MVDHSHSDPEAAAHDHSTGLGWGEQVDLGTGTADGRRMAAAVDIAKEDMAGERSLDDNCWKPWTLEHVRGRDAHALDPIAAEAGLEGEGRLPPVGGRPRNG